MGKNFTKEETAIFFIFCAIFLGDKDKPRGTLIEKNGEEISFENETLRDKLGQKTTFYPEIPQNSLFQKCEICEK